MRRILAAAVLICGLGLITLTTSAADEHSAAPSGKKDPAAGRTAKFHTIVNGKKTLSNQTLREGGNLVHTLDSGEKVIAVAKGGRVVRIQVFDKDGKMAAQSSAASASGSYTFRVFGYEITITVTTDGEGNTTVTITIKRKR